MDAFNQVKGTLFSSILNFTDDVPNKNEVKAMLAEALSIGVKISMKNHIYRFNNETRVQMDGGSIGVELTGELSEMEMLKIGK